MRRLISMFVTVALILSVVVIAPAHAGEWSPSIVWKSQKVGKLSSELQMAPNGLFYAHSGDKLTVFDESGRSLWDVTGKGSGRNAGQPVFDSQGSIFIPGRDMIREIKLNGSTGWNFNIYLKNSGSDAQLTAGPGGLLYLHLPSALYAVDTVGRYKWMLLQWNADRNGFSKMEDFNVLAAAGDERAVLAVVGRDKGGSQLLAINREGEIQWRYSIGEAKSAYMAFGPDGLLYVTVNPNKLGQSSNGAVYAFDVEGSGKPVWSFKITSDKLTAPTPSSHDLLYFMAGEKLYALDQDTGKEVWSNIFLKAQTRPAVDESSRRVYLGTGDKRLLAVNSSGRLDWSLNLDGNISMRPMIGPGGYLYVNTDSGDMYKIKDLPPASNGGD